MGSYELGEKRNWDALKVILREHDKFVFSTHVEPDADGLGSQLGLARFMKRIGKTVHILNPSTLRVNLEFLPHENEIQVYDRNKHAQILANSDVIIAFDIGHFNRLKTLSEDIVTTDILKISIDHHPGDKSQFDLIFDSPTASSTGVLIYDLISEMDDPVLDEFEIAQPLYAAMMSDTGNFRFNNTDPETFRAAARLVAAGVKPNDVYVHIYEDLNTPGRLLVLEHLLKELRYDCDGRLAWSTIDFQELNDQGVTPDDLHSLSDFIRSIKGVEIGVSITKIPGQPTDISLRSKGQIPVNTVAMHFDGGGHAFAAGCHIDVDLKDAAEAVVEQCRIVIKDWDASA
ncbi:bifunctional oligoribonuclease/PAP phosphatase NrnA [bacterium]|nr:bifunctional oligoribonuclease/PAP phosphatase NrnA [bacterium]